MLGKCRQPDQASLLFEMLEFDGLQPTVDMYTALVGVYGPSDSLDKAFDTVNYMKSVPNCKPEVYTYSILIKCCAPSLFLSPSLACVSIMWNENALEDILKYVTTSCSMRNFDPIGTAYKLTFQPLVALYIFTQIICFLLSFWPHSFSTWDVSGF